jgi:hypothetical protein
MPITSGASAWNQELESLRLPAVYSCPVFWPDGVGQESRAFNLAGYTLCDVLVWREIERPGTIGVAGGVSERQALSSCAQGFGNSGNIAGKN